MFGKMAKFAYNFSRNTAGMVGGIPRIHNVTKNSDVVGRVQVNTQATNAFNRTKIHKGYFYGPDSVIDDGDLIQDRQDNAHYFVMSVKAEWCAEETVYIDGTLYWCDSQVVVSRFGLDGTKDTFGRVTQPAPQPVGSGSPIYAMTVPKNYDTVIQPDRLIPQDKISLVVQEGVDVKVADRLTVVGTGEVYKVDAISLRTVKGLKLLYVDVDVR